MQRRLDHVRCWCFGHVVTMCCLMAGSAFGQSAPSAASAEADSASFWRLVDVSSPAYDGVLSRMTLEEKVGTLLMTRLGTATVEPFIRDFHSGSFVIWGEVEGVKNVAEFCDLANRAQELSLKYRRLPIWLHGQTVGLGWRPDWISKAAEAGADIDEVEKAAAVFGRRWRAVGMHNLPQPCLNVPLYSTGIMLEWAISRDPKLVARYGLALTRGTLAARCGTMAQHFPAHGATPLDSHKAFPVVDLPREELWRDHLACYQACFDAGCTTLCTAHLACLALDPDPKQIASTSSRILTDFLRGEMKYRGLVLCDDVWMRGFQKNGPPERIAVEAVRAGCDSICICDPQQTKAVFESLLQAARDGRLTGRRLDASVKRHLGFMEWVGLFRETRVSAEAALELLKNEADNALLKKVTGDRPGGGLTPRHAG
jgi:beta-N-acetylhexosaminidase